MPARLIRALRRRGPEAGVARVFLLLGLLVAAGTVATVTVLWQGRHQAASAELKAVAELRHFQVEGWLRERLNVARFVADSAVFGEQLLRFRDAGDGQSLARLTQRGEDLARANGGLRALVYLSGRGIVAESPPADRPTLAGPGLDDAVRSALSTGDALMAGPFDPPASADQPAWLDLIIPLRTTGRPAAGAVLLRFDLRRQFEPLLGAWPVPSDSGESLLWQPRSTVLRALSRPRLAASAALPEVAVDDAQRPAARAARGEVGVGDVMRGTDYRGVPVLTTVSRIESTGWLLATKMDQAEAQADTRHTIAWVLGLSALMLAGLVLGARGALHRQRLRQAEQEQRRQRERMDSLLLLQAVADASGDALFAKDLQGRYTLYNAAAAAMIGRTPADVIGRTDAELFSPERATEFAASDARVLQSGEREVFEEAFEAGSVFGERLALCSKGPLRDAQGRIVGLFGVSRGVTDERAMTAEIEQHRHHLQELVDARTDELRESHARLAEAERFLRTLTDSLPTRVAYWDAEMRCRFANQAYRQWFGMREPVLGRSFVELLGQGHYDAIRREVERGLAGEALVFERERVDAEGQLRTQRVHYVPDVGPDGRVRGLLITGSDITQLKQTQARLSQALEAAEAGSRAKSAFLANMSHEIRTPMNAIIGLAHLVQRDASDPRQRERLAKVADAAQHLLQIINDILDLSKIEAGRMALEHGEFSLDRLLARSFEMVAERAREHGLELILDTDSVPDRLVGDATRLAQAVLNLLSNAVKFTEQGWVRLQAELLARDGRRVQLRFSVRDTGPGIAPERQGALFKPFEQVDNSATRRHGGTGLGLALTRRLAELMGGEAGLQSTPGEGSLFWFTAWLDVAALPAAKGQGEAAAHLRLAGRRVLLVDDLPEARAALHERLRLFDMTVDALESGEAAVSRLGAQLAAGRPYDVLLIDWRMLPLDGLQTLARLRAVAGEGLPPAVLVTAYDDDAMRRDARIAGFAQVLVKPITASTLHDTLVQVLGMSSQGPPLDQAAPGEAEAALRDRHAGTVVLVAEDNPINQEVALSLLSAAGLQPVLAGDGAEAVRLAQSQPVALALMDMQMPGLDGLEATRRLRAGGFTRPIIAMTANAFGDDRAACLAAGMNDHLAKPVDPERLYTMLLRWLPERATAEAAPAGASARVAGRLADALAQVPGVDVFLALRTANGQDRMLRRIVEIFATHYAEGVPALAVPATDARALGVWREAAHSMQGACGSIGAVALQARAQTLVAQVRRGESAPSLAAEAQALHEDVRALAARLRSLLDAT